MSEVHTEGFHHVTMVSSDAQRTLDFYSGLLGLSLVKRTVNFDDPSAHHLYFGDPEGSPGSLLTFFEWADSPRGRWGVGGVHHVALRVDDAGGQLKWKRRLMDAGVSVTGPYDRGYFKSIYFSDPDGQILEIATAGPGYAIDEPLDALGRSVTLPPTAELRGDRDEVAIAEATHPDPVTEITPDMTLRSLHHVTAITDDIERAGDFYEEAVGLALVKKSLNQDDRQTPHWFWASYDGERVAPASSMTLFEWKASTYEPRVGVGQTHHVAFRAPTEDAQLAARDRLLSLGIDVTDVQDRLYFRSIYFRAPDGLLCEIATDGPGFALDEPTGELGSSLTLPPWLEPERASIEAELTTLVRGA